GYRVVHNEPVLDGLTGSVRAVLERCLAKDPAERPGTDELVREFAEVLPEPPTGEPGKLMPGLPASPAGPSLDGLATATGRHPRWRRARTLLAASGVLAVALTGYRCLR
ncbi:serine/threonine protein kinase, partial [Streptomyces sp. NPDC004561]